MNLYKQVFDTTYKLLIICNKNVDIKISLHNTFLE